MKKYRNRNHKHAVYLFISVTMFLSACSKVTPVLPGGKQSVSLNFYSASDVMLAAYGNAASSATAILVDSLYTGAARKNGVTQNNFAVFNYHFNDGLEYPTVDGGFMNFVYYNNRPQGMHLYFTDTANTILKDTVIHPEAQSYNTVYLADAPAAQQNQPAVFHVLPVPIDRSAVPAGKLGIQFVHLSPDAGSLNCSLLRSDGSTAPLLAAPLAYGNVSAYQYVDSTAAVSGIIKLDMNNNSTGADIRAGFTFSPGRRYIVLIIGFFEAQQRQLAQGGGKYGSVSIQRNLRVVVRKSY